MEMKKVDDYFNIKETEYIRLLKTSGKWREFYKEKEGIASFIIACIFTAFLYLMFRDNLDNLTNELFQNLSLNIALSLIGLLGFTISGLAVFTGTITNKLVKYIDNDNKGHRIINILYSFYFIGGVDALEILLLLMVYLITYSDLLFHVPLTYVCFFIIEYLLNFIILYSVSLLGTCIKLFLVGYKYFLKNEENENLNK